MWCGCVVAAQEWTFLVDDEWPTLWADWRASLADIAVNQWSYTGRQQWLPFAACADADPTVFDTRNDVAEAFCNSCPVRSHCLEDAIVSECVGVFRGGESFVEGGV